MRQIKIVLCILLVLFVAGCGAKKEDKVKDKDKNVEKGAEGPALIWEVKSETTKIYLVGSIHTANKDTYPLKQVLLDAFAESEELAVEIDMLKYQEDYEAQLSLLQAMMYTDGTTVKDHLSEETFDMLETFIDEGGMTGMPKEFLYLYKPICLMSLIDDQVQKGWGYDSELGIDLYFLKKAKERNMPVIELESVLEQTLVLTSFSEKLQDVLLRSSIEAAGEEDNVKPLLDLWIAGDANQFNQYMQESDQEVLDETGKELADEYTNKLLIVRNTGMVKKAEEMLKGKKVVFYVVGSAHMFGDSGLINQLEQKGYTVTQKK